jgi:hypothetical protein
MKTIERRLRKLEDRFGPEVETEQDRWLAARLDAAARRRKEAELRGECQPVERGPEFEIHREMLRRALGRRAWQ